MTKEQSTEMIEDRAEFKSIVVGTGEKRIVTERSRSWKSSKKGIQKGVSCSRLNMELAHAEARTKSGNILLLPWKDRSIPLETTLRISLTSSPDPETIKAETRVTEMS
jgi:hypothetical protein